MGFQIGREPFKSEPEVEEAEALECLDAAPGEECVGAVEYRMALSGTGISFPRCDKHWADRVRVQEEIDARYPQLAPADFDPGYAGERWDED